MPKLDCKPRLAVAASATASTAEARPNRLPKNEVDVDDDIEEEEEEEKRLFVMLFLVPLLLLPLDDDVGRDDDQLEGTSGGGSWSIRS